MSPPSLATGRVPTSVHASEHVVTRHERCLNDDMHGLQQECPVGEIEQQHHVEPMEQNAPHQH